MFGPTKLPGPLSIVAVAVCVPASIVPLIAFTVIVSTWFVPTGFVSVAGAIVVTTPQLVSLADSRRALSMYKKLNIPPLGIVENMSYFVCPNCAHESDIFGHGGGDGLAREAGVPFLGRVPIYQPIREGSDKGVPLLVAEPDSPAARAIREVAERAAAQVSIASYKRTPIPLTPVR